MKIPIMENTKEKMQKVKAIGDMIINLKNLPPSKETKITIQKLQQEIDEILGFSLE